MKRLILIAIILSTISACRKVECEDFNLSHEVVDWHLFPDRQQDYVYESDSSSIILTQTVFNLSDYEKYRCHMCACSQSFFSTYSNDVNTFVSVVSYNSLNDADRPGIQYQLDDINLSFNLMKTGSINGIESDGTPYNENIIFDVLDTLNLRSNIYHQVLRVEFLDDVEIKRIWVAYRLGLVGFELNGEVYTRN